MHFLHQLNKQDQPLLGANKQISNKEFSMMTGKDYNVTFQTIYH